MAKSPIEILGGPVPRDEPQTVAGFICPTLNNWNVELLNRSFDELTSFEHIAGLLWEIWKAQNHFVFRRQRISPDQIVESVFALANLQISTQQQELTGRSPWLNPNRTWLPLEQGTVKINMDGAFPTMNQMGAIASIARNHSGSLIEGFTRSVSASSGCRV